MPEPISASATIPAPPQHVYAIIADYNQGHPKIIPTPPFVGLVVTQGGTGAGTTFRAQMRVMGQLQTFHGTVSEPEPGRMLVETTDTGYITTFTVEPRAEGRESFVSIATELEGRKGLLGALEYWLIGRLLRPTYEKELAQLHQVATS